MNIFKVFLELCQSYGMTLSKLWNDVVKTASKWVESQVKFAWTIPNVSSFGEAKAMQWRCQSYAMSVSKLCNEQVKTASKWVESRIYSNYPECEQFRRSQSYAFILSNSINCFKTKMKTKSATKQTSRCTLCLIHLQRRGRLILRRTSSGCQSPSTWCRARWWSCQHIA